MVWPSNWICMSTLIICFPTHSNCASTFVFDWLPSQVALEVETCELSHFYFQPIRAEPSTPMKQHWEMISIFSPSVRLRHCAQGSEIFYPWGWGFAAAEATAIGISSWKSSVCRSPIAPSKFSRATLLMRSDRSIPCSCTRLRRVASVRNLRTTFRISKML